MRSPEAKTTYRRPARRLTQAVAMSGAMLLVACGGGDEKSQKESTRVTSVTSTMPNTPSTLGEVTTLVPAEGSIAVPNVSTATTLTTLAPSMAPGTKLPPTTLHGRLPETTLPTGASDTSGPPQQPGQSPPVPPTTTPAVPVRGAVYYQPRLSDLHDPQSTIVPASVYTMFAETGRTNTWPIGSCRADGADDFVNQAPNAHVLVGFSLGRVGLAYFQQVASPQLKSQIDTMVAVAPGNLWDFTDSCDPATTGSDMRNWLEEDANRRFMVIADDRTEENNFEGIRSLYLDAMIGSPAVGQLIVCVTDQGGHEASWNSVKADVFADPRSCPPASVRI